MQGHSEELARAAEEQHEGISPSASTSGSSNGSGGNGGQSAACRTTSGDVVAYMEDYDTSIPTLNTVRVLSRSFVQFQCLICLYTEITAALNMLALLQGQLFVLNIPQANLCQVLVLTSKLFFTILSSYGNCLSLKEVLNHVKSFLASRYVKNQSLHSLRNMEDTVQSICFV